MVKLGQVVIDRVSDFKGTVIGITTFLNGCRRIGVAPKVDKDGKLQDTQWFDEPQLRIVSNETELTGQQEIDRKVGGPMPSIPTQNNPK